MINISSLSAPPSVGTSVITEANTNGEVSTNQYKKLVIDTSNNTIRVKTSIYGFGELSFENNVSSITPSAIATPMLIAFASTLYQNTLFSSTANSRLTYTGTASAVFRITIQASLYTATNNQNLQLFWAKSGSVQTRSAAKTTTSSNSKQLIVVHSVATMNPNEYIEAYVSNDTSTGAIFCENLYISAIAIPL